MTDFESMIPQRAREEILASQIAAGPPTPRRRVPGSIKFKWMLRPVAKSGTFPHGIEEEWVECEYTPEEWEVMRGLRRVMDEPDQETRLAAMRSACAIHEMKALLDARMVGSGTVAEREPQEDKPRPDHNPGSSRPPSASPAVTATPSRSATASDDNTEEVNRVREEAIERSDRGPSDEWKEHAAEIIEETARRLPELTSENVWETGLRKPDRGSKDGDALGPAMRRAAAAGIIEVTDRYSAETNRPQRHNNPKRVWRSLIYPSEPTGLF